MYCPKCGLKQRCGCNTCKKRNRRKGIVEIWIDGENVACGRCGLTMNADWWEDLDLQVNLHPKITEMVEKEKSRMKKM